MLISNRLHIRIVIQGSKRGLHAKTTADVSCASPCMQLLVVFTRVGSYIRVPGVDVDRFAESMRAGGGGLLGTIDQLSGGSISRFGLFSLGRSLLR
jgi:hypothetical protein